MSRRGAYLQRRRHEVRRFFCAEFAVFLRLRRAVFFMGAKIPTSKYFF